MVRSMLGLYLRARGAEQNNARPLFALGGYLVARAMFRSSGFEESELVACRVVQSVGRQAASQFVVADCDGFVLSSFDF
jgi:hypothetical protein